MNFNKSPIRTKPWPDNNTIGIEEIEIVNKVLKTGKLSGFEGSYFPTPGFSFYGGKYVRELEEKWSIRYNTKYAISMNSATSAIMASLAALDIGFGDEVIVPVSTMTACAPLSMYFGAIPIFADIEEKTGSICPKSLAKFLSPRTKCIMIVHQYGNPANLKEILKLAKQHNIKVIEDCSQAYDAKYKDQFVGTFGEIGIFSLNINKTIHSGEGGVCITDDEILYKKLCLYRNHGENAVEHLFPDEQIHNMIGLNLRLSEIHAAIGMTQLDKLHDLNNMRIQLANYLIDGLKRFSFLSVIQGYPENENVFYQFPILINPAQFELSIREIHRFLIDQGILILLGPRPLYKQNLYQNKTVFKYGYPFSADENKDIKTNYETKNFPIAEKHEQNVLIFEHCRPPCTFEDMDDVINAFAKLESLSLS